MSNRVPFAKTAFAATLLACAGAGAAAAQTVPTDPVTGLRGFSAQSSAGTMAPLASPKRREVAGSPSGSTMAGQTVSGDTTAGLTKPRVKKPNTTRPQKQAKPLLPALVPYRTAPGQRARAAGRMATQAPGPTVAVVPFPTPARPRVEADPYKSVGVRVGNVVLRPAFEADGGYSDNPNGVNRNVKGSSFSRVGGALDAQSDWGAHEFTAKLRGGYTKFFDIPDADRPDFQGAASLKLDIARDTRALLEAKANIDSQRPGSPEITSLGTRGAKVKGRPLVYNEGAAAGLTQTFGRFETTLRGTVDRTEYQDATLTDGARLLLSNQDFTTLGGSLRLGYEATPGVKPFVEASIDKRTHDKTIDDAGFRRDSNGVTGRAGTSFEITRTLTGEASAGYTRRQYDDPRLKDLRGPVFDAALIWTASPLTTVTLKGSTVFDESTIAGASGSINRKASVQLSHALLRNLTLTGMATIGQRDYRGVAVTEKTVAFGLGAEYALTRSIAVRGSFTHDRLKSTAPNSDYTANVFLLGLKLQP